MSSPHVALMKMKRIGFRSVLALFVAAAAVVPGGADTYPRQPGLDVAHYVFRIGLSDETDAIQGEATVDIRLLQDDVSRLTLDLAQPTPENPDRGMTVTQVTEKGEARTFGHVGDRLEIVLDPPGHEGERRRLVIAYGGVPASGLVIGPNKHGDRTFFSNNWPNKARQWLPTLDHPYDKATCELVVTAPAHYQVVSNGLLIEETDLGEGRRRTHWRQSVPISPWLYVLGVARFAVDHRRPWRGIPIETWVYPQDRDTGFQAFAEPTIAVLDFLADRVGPYPYERLAHIQSKSVNGGMEAATSIFYGEPSATGEQAERWRRVIIHEIAHQWFGNAVTEGDWDDVWLSEGFATYFTRLFVEHAQGRDELVAWLLSDKNEIREFDGKNPDYRIVHDELSDMEKVVTGPGTYKKGSWVLHMLRGLVGDDAFWRGIRAYYKTHRDGSASTADFRGAMEEASRSELGWFFDQWLTRGGMIQARARWSWDSDSGTLRLSVEQAQEGPPFRMPIEVGLEMPGEEQLRVEEIEMRDRRGVFTFPLDLEPRGAVLDPRTLVLMDSDIRLEDPEER